MLGAGQEYEQRLRQQHKKLHPRTAWARRRPADPQLGEGGAAEPSAYVPMILLP